MPLYNLTGIATNSTTYLGFYQGVNDNLMFGWLGPLILLGLWIILVSSYFIATGDIGKSISGGSFLAFVFSFFLSAVGLITNDLFLYAPLIIAAISTAMYWKKD